MTELWSGGGGSRAQYLYKNSPWDQQNQEVLYFPLPAELAQLWGKTKAKQQNRPPQQHRWTERTPWRKGLEGALLGMRSADLFLVTCSMGGSVCPLHMPLLISTAEMTF